MADTLLEPVISVSCATEYPAYEADKNEKCWGLVTLKASYYEPEESKRPALDIVAVIDKSGSMGGQKLVLVKKSLEFLVENLLEKDRLCVVTYDSHVHVNFKLLPMNKKNKTFAKKEVGKIAAGSSTNLCGGLLQGLCEIIDRVEKNEASVLLFTDGLANQGITETSQIIRAMRNPKHYIPVANDRVKHRLKLYQNMPTQVMQCTNVAPELLQLQQVPIMQSQEKQQLSIPVQQSHEEQLSIPIQQSAEEQVQVQQLPMQQLRVQEAWKTPVPESSSAEVPNSSRVHEEKVEVDSDASVYTFGFGDDHDPHLLKAISDAARGMYFYIKNESEITQSFGHCLGGLVSALGKDIQLKLQLGDGVTMDTIHTHQRYSSDGPSMWLVNVGDMQSEEQRDILLLLNLPPASSSPDTTTIVKSSITYFSIVDSKYKSSEAEMVVMRSDNVHHSPEVANRSIDQQRNRILTTKAMEESLQLAEEHPGELELARARLQREIERIKSSLTGEDELCKLLVKDLEHDLSGLRDREFYVKSGRKAKMNMLQMHSKQRSNRTEANSYVSVSNMMYQDLFTIEKGKNDQ